MDRDGRIPAVEKPVKHPERWRYIPEGRIKPGNVFERFLISSFIAPFIFRDTDVGFGGGLALTDIDFREQRRREFLGLFAVAHDGGAAGVHAPLAALAPPHRPAARAACCRRSGAACAPG